MKAVDILEGFFPEDGRVADFKAMVASAKEVSID